MKKFDYTRSDIINSLQEVGVDKGDSIFIHSNLGFFGTLEDVDTTEEYWRIFKDAIFQVITNEGTLIVPTFTYSFCWNQEFELDFTPSTVGMFSEMVRKDSESKRSEDANFSISAIGKNYIYFTKDSPSHSFGKDSFWERFIQMDGKICCFNVGLMYNTLIHYVEKLVSVPYRFDKSFNGVFVKNGLREKRTYTHFCRDLSDPRTIPDLSKLNKISYDSGKAKDAKLGRGQISCISARDVVDIIKNEIEKNTSFLIKEKI